MTWDGYDNDGPLDETCDHCGRYVDACNVDPCLPADLDDDEDDPDAPHSYPCPTCGGNGCRSCRGTGERTDES